MQTYNGNATGITARQQVDVSEPVGTDVRNSQSIRTPLERLANFVQWLMSNVAVLGDNGGARISNVGNPTTAGDVMVRGGPVVSAPASGHAVTGTGGGTGFGGLFTGGSGGGGGVYAIGAGGATGVTAYGGAPGAVAVSGLGGSNSGDIANDIGAGGSFAGGPRAVGLVAQAGDYATTPGRAALRVVPQAAPQYPLNGDIWVETGTNTLRVRINGVTKTVTLT